MKYLKNIIKSLLLTFLFFMIFSLLITLLNYYNIINHQTLEICKIIIPILSMMFGGLLMGKKTSKNGWLEGLKLSLIIIFILIMISIILKEFEFKNLTFFLILIISGIFGSILGINTKNT